MIEYFWHLLPFSQSHLPRCSRTFAGCLTHSMVNLQHGSRCRLQAMLGKLHSCECLLACFLVLQCACTFAFLGENHCKEMACYADYNNAPKYQTLACLDVELTSMFPGQDGRETTKISDTLAHFRRLDSARLRASPTKTGSRIKHHLESIRGFHVSFSRAS